MVDRSRSDACPREKLPVGLMDLNDRAGPHGTHEVGFADHVAGGGDQNLENLESTVSEWN
jgi:hypothetical protein